MRLQTLGTHYRLLGIKLAKEKDPQSLVELTERRGVIQKRIIGSGMLALVKQRIEAERTAFEADFGNR